MNEDVIAYVAGIFDSDGCITNNSKNSLNVIIAQAEKGKNVLEFIQKYFGGNILKQSEATDKHQACYCWRINNNKDVNNFLQIIYNHILVKKNQVKIALEYPCEHIKNYRITAKNTKTNNNTEYYSVLSCCKELEFIYHTIIKQFERYDIIEEKDWILEKHSLTDKQIQKINKKRGIIIKELKCLKTIPHEDIPNDFIPKKAYLAGFFDGDGCIEVKGNSAHCHSVSQKYKPILEVFQRLYDGSICHKQGRIYTWHVTTKGPEFLKDILPFLILKKEQAELALSMNKKEAYDIHTKLRQMKGKYDKPLLEKKESQLQKRPLKENKTSTYRGVVKCNRKWRATISKDNINYDLGCYTYEIDAAKAYNKKALELYGPTALLNEIPENIVLETPKGVVNSKSNYRGVELHGKKWRASIYCKGTTYRLGTYDDIKDAARAYNKKAIELLGNEAQLNFIE